ncbi:phosphoribosylformylglycinamidine synthase I [archaeon]|nr:phosphoribosylformylglycinamidine synthase I [archaeon]
MVKAIILRVEGTNCDEELVNAFQLAGAEVTLAHINELLKNKISLEDHQILALPGGFSHGDDISAGVILANQLKQLLGKQLNKFIEEEKAVIGICNGFQILVKTGLLPNLSGNQEQEVTLAFNSSGLFRNQWVHLETQKENTCPFLKNMENIYLPIAHAEGRFIATQETIEQIEEQNLIAFKYVGNPNGSINDIAGISNSQGNILGLMPHPERFLHPWMHPYWTLEQPEQGDGIQLFKNIVEHAKKV